MDDQITFLLRFQDLATKTLDQTSLMAQRARHQFDRTSPAADHATKTLEETRALLADLAAALDRLPKPVPPSRPRWWTMVLATGIGLLAGVALGMR
ncbi:hypothetical protein TSO352_32125 [Azospirillum sp. TSO35-2]|nr:hypothetical protein TSO352_32125 [Azospirillum sp. TSO35-2]